MSVKAVVVCEKCGETEEAHGRPTAKRMDKLLSGKWKTARVNGKDFVLCAPCHAAWQKLQRDRMAVAWVDFLA